MVTSSPHRWTGRGALVLTTTAALGAALVLPVAHAEEVSEHIVNGTFDSDTAPWWTSNTTASVVDGQACLDVPGGTTNPWDVIFGQDGVELIAGETYAYSFTARATRTDPEQSTPVRALIQMPVDPYTAYLEKFPALTEDLQTFEYTFTATADRADGQVAFQIGGSAAPWTLCLDDVSLLGSAALEPYQPDTGPRVRVNQVAYLPEGPKGATLVTERTRPMMWQVEDAAGSIVGRGLTRAHGVDESSGQNVQTIDFSKVRDAGTGLTLVVDGERSHPFDIGSEEYERLRVDALSFFYPQRSGTPIDGAVAGEEYARAAGHVSSPADGAVNQGDLDVPCQQPEVSQGIYGEPWTCDYTLDVVGGWYDAGDHGKYVVNGGISVAQVMSTYERTLTAPTADPGALGDGTLRVPEQGNGVPDVLDEARWQLEFMLSMQVPDGAPLAGMVHHKIHDKGWTGLPLDPAADPQVRELHRPSTAATLNLAATAAQGARLFAPYDEAFSAELLAAARSTYAAAKSNPPLYAPAADGADGGGPYNDSDVTDEYYWAAAELYLTTGEDAFLADVHASPLHEADVFTPAGFNWGNVAALARMDLATVPSDLPDQGAVRRSVLDGADGYLDAQRDEPYGQPYDPTDGTYVWGSNSQVLNNMVVLGTAFDLSGRERYRDGVLEGMDYLLGRNALNLSYITGYGDVFSENQHSRWYANQINSALPHPPDGSVAGGPNSDTPTWDPVAQANLQGCAPQFCYIDDIQSWSTNEITINWNSALSWVASFVADQGDGERQRRGRAGRR